MTAIAIGPGPSLDEALEEVRRVGLLVGGETAQKWARELREIATLLAERSPRGPKGSLWPREAARLKLACTIAGIGHRNREGLAGAKALAAKLEELAGKSLAPEDQVKVLALHRALGDAIREEGEQIRLAGKATGSPLENLEDVLGDMLEGKAIRDAAGPWGPTKRQAFIELIEAGGGGTGDGKPFDGDPLAASDASFARAEAVVRDEVEPTVAERAALERFHSAPRP
jgi:hypothetical protein